jgi:hypothetical protein
VETPELPLPFSSFWPEGLETFFFSLFLLKEEFDIERLRKGLDANPSPYEYDDDKKRLSVPLLGRANFDGIIGIARFQESEGGWGLRLQVLTSDDSTRHSGASVIDLSAFPSLLAQCLSSDPSSEVGSIRASVFLPANAWQSTIVLPVPMPGVLDEALGLPRLAGVEFEIDSSKSPLTRVEVSLSPNHSEIYLQIVARFALYPTDDFYSRGLRTLTEAMQLFVHKTPSAQVASNA